MTPTPTVEQSAILSAALNRPENLMIQALAGCAKTTTLEMIANALPPGPALAVAYNVKIKKELEKRFPTNFKVMTLNGLGHQAWCKALGYATKVTIDDRKLGRLVTTVSKARGIDLKDRWDDVRQTVSGAMLAGLVPSAYPHKGLVPDRMEIWDDIATDVCLGLDEECLSLARDILIASIKEGFDGIISFDDQLYLSTMFNGVFAQYPLVLVDEAQDLSPLNHIQIAKSSGRTGRLIVVGDSRQAIYGFRGADANSMEKLRALRPDIPPQYKDGGELISDSVPAWLDLPLHLTFRCPKRIVRRQLAHAPGFTAHSSTSEGDVLNWMDPPNYQHGEDDSVSWGLSELQPFLGEGFAILCRNNGPLFTMAMRLLRNGIGCVMLGRDIGKNLIALSKKLCPSDSIPAKQVILAINEWRTNEIAELLSKEKEHKVASVEDRAESLLAVLEFGPCATSGELRAKLAELFDRESGPVTLSTIHRAKGLEWNHVMILDPWRIPSHFARKAASKGDDRQMLQELNLRYVAETRTKNTLILSNLEDFLI